MSQFHQISTYYQALLRTCYIWLKLARGTGSIAKVFIHMVFLSVQSEGVERNFNTVFARQTSTDVSIHNFMARD
jgi:hypothetical protein